MTSDQLRSVVERIEKLNEEKRAVAADLSEVYKEAKSNGFDTKALRELIKLRQLNADERSAREEILETYLVALGMLSGGAQDNE